jgi:hypothetical protein
LKKKITHLPLVTKQIVIFFCFCSHLSDGGTCGVASGTSPCLQFGGATPVASSALVRGASPALVEQRAEAGGCFLQ